jgi:hypothetical protein
MKNANQSPSAVVMIRSHHFMANPEIIKLLSKEYQVNKIIDDSRLKAQHLFLEGIGSMVLDHSNIYVYTVTLNRISERVLNQFCKDFDYQPVAFTATDDHNVAAYHTNILMSIATDFVLVGLLKARY